MLRWEACRPVTRFLQEIAFRRINRIPRQGVQTGNEVAVEVLNVTAPWESERAINRIRTAVVAGTANLGGRLCRHMVRVHDEVLATTVCNVASARSVAFFTTDAIVNSRILCDQSVNRRDLDTGLMTT